MRTSAPSDGRLRPRSTSETNPLVRGHPSSVWVMPRSRRRARINEPRFRAKAEFGSLRACPDRAGRRAEPGAGVPALARERIATGLVILDFGMDRSIASSHAGRTPRTRAGVRRPAERSLLCEVPAPRSDRRRCLDALCARRAAQRVGRARRWWPDDLPALAGERSRRAVPLTRSGSRTARTGLERLPAPVRPRGGVRRPAHRPDDAPQTRGTPPLLRPMRRPPRGTRQVGARF